jgi:hypothetical protein
MGRKLNVPREDFIWMPKPGALYYYREEEGGAERINHF